MRTKLPREFVTKYNVLAVIIEFPRDPPTARRFATFGSRTTCFLQLFKSLRRQGAAAYRP
jgi:hypothetical protein